MRGYGKTSAWAIDAYDINHLVGDVVAVANHLNQGRQLQLVMIGAHLLRGSLR